MKKVLLLMTALVAGLQSWAESGTCGENLTWEYADGTLTVSGTGAMTDYTDEDAVPWASFRNDIKAVVIGEGVTTIGSFVFCVCSNLETAELPSTVTKIGEYAFPWTALASIDIPNSVTTIGDFAFYNTKISELVIPNSITSIGTQVFGMNTALTSVTIPSSVTSIGTQAFGYCTSLASVTIYSSSATLGGLVFVNNASDRKIYVPADCVDAYKSETSWASYASDIEAIPDGTLEAQSADGSYWATYYNPLANVKVDAGTKVYTAALSGDAVALTEVGDKIIKAGEAVILESANASITLSYVGAEATGAFSGNSLEGVGAATAPESGSTYYVLGDGSKGVGFYKYTGTLGANKAFIKTAAADARAFIGIDGTTGMERLTPALSEGEGVYYDLSGRRVQAPKKGLYIVNGKKVVFAP